MNEKKKLIGDNTQLIQKGCGHLELIDWFVIDLFDDYKI